jgi:hypothetical protein
MNKICKNCHYFETFMCWHWSISPNHLPNDTCEEFYPLDKNVDEVRISVKDEEYMHEIEEYARSLGVPS